MIARYHGMVTSGILHLTWIVHVICGVPELYRWIDTTSTVPSDELKTGRCAAFFIWFVLLVAQALAFCFADPRSADEQEKSKLSPELNSSFLNRLTLWWFNPLPILGSKKDLELDDLFMLNEGSKSEFLNSLWERYWNPSIESEWNAAVLTCQRITLIRIHGVL